MDKPYQRQTGDLEIRILPDGRLVFVAPDEALIELAQSLDLVQKEEQPQEEKPDHDGHRPDADAAANYE